MSLVLYGHPFSSYTQKVLIALYENGTPFEFRCIGPDTPQHSAEWLKRWPLRKFPLLVDGERNIVETSIIIEYLQLAHPGPVRLLPADPMAALDVRFLDRFFDLHVMEAMQIAVDSALKRVPGEERGRTGPRQGKAGARLRLARRTACRQDLGGWRGLHAGGLRGRALIVLRGLDAPDFRGFSRAARLPRAVACPPILRPGGRGGAAVSASLPPGSAGSGLKPRATSHGGV